MSSLSIIIVSWNTRELLRRCLDSIEAGRGKLDIEIIVVDNGSGDGTPEMVRGDFPTVTLLEPGRNLGFSAGNNTGLARARGDWLLLLNPDTEIVGDALSTLIEFLNAHPTAGVVGPRLLYASGDRQPSRHRFPTLFTLFVASTPLHSPLRFFLRRYYMSETPEGNARPVDWLSGAALMLRREAYSQVGGLDERFFMYYEETDLQRRIKAAGWSIWHLPTATIRHYEDASSGQVVALRHIRFNESRLCYTAKWHGARWASVLKRWLVLLFAMEWLKEGARWLVGHKRPLRLQRLQEYGRLVRELGRAAYD